MGLDSNLTAAGASTPVTPLPDPTVFEPQVVRATTPSMQNLLAQYFAQNPSPSATKPSPASAHTPEDAAVEAKPDETSWPQAARDEIAALRAEVASLRGRLENQTLMLRSAQAQADGDVLTPTLNRRAFLREVHRAMADCKRYGEQAALIYIDMDGFKSINDAFGHAAGDAALIYVAEVLNANVREGDSVGRMGGDEFAVLLRHADINSARVKAMKLEAELAEGTFLHNGKALKTGGSFGVRAYNHQPSAEAWLAEADAAMFLIKKAAR